MAGKHRKTSPMALTWRTTGGVIVGAAVLGTAAATAQASVLPFGSEPSKPVTAQMAIAKTAPGHASKPGAKTTGRPAPARASRSAPRTAPHAVP
ncbi:hypothetical protein E1298_44810, partial [Actinomadura rubrisoli]